ncbi:FAD-dependent oxidoreductase, partial [Streptomyces viridochromogenes]|uniref:FAD-dependent oxidoreductase n=1 Tax=Streptomyces viridochromogenes TaxID=1938 RepID=UPI001F346A82
MSAAVVGAGLAGASVAHHAVAVTGALVRAAHGLGVRTVLCAAGSDPADHRGGRVPGLIAPWVSSCPSKRPP